ncbi:hypothetical protein [Sphingomonas lacusdianchii]|uniref:hypothetical protein n=1 Tax=Sphingomonas lacusdianchii TaxID=2917992 RepID=UPI001F574095|nr:hypothetical protein [Sphingomonas sp. JXJ CY 53]
MRNQIELELVGEAVVLTFRSDIGRVMAVHEVDHLDAFHLSLLMEGERPKVALNFTTKDGLWLQIENWPYNRASLMVPMPDSVDLVAQLEGDGIDNLGRSLRSLHSHASRPTCVSSVNTRGFHYLTYLYRDIEVDGDERASGSEDML